MTKLIHGCPAVALAVVCQIYTWMNVTHRMFVERFGCGCPSLDGSWHFNTNHLTMIVLALAGVGSLLPHFWLIRRVPDKHRTTYLVACGMVVGGICLFTVGRNMWL